MASAELPFLCEVQAVGLLYFNLASIMWTSCFAFTLYRDVVPSYRRQALRKCELSFRRLASPSVALHHPPSPSITLRRLPSPSVAFHHLPSPSITLRRLPSPSTRYELYFHLLCWPLPALLCGSVASLGYLGDSGSWCALSVAYSKQYLICFYVPLLCAFAFNLVTYTAVLSHSRERRVSRITSLYLLGFTIVWLPSLICRLQVFLSPSHTPSFLSAALEALCMPLQGALNALVYGWSLPSIRDVYRTMLLGTDGLDALQISPSQDSMAVDSPTSFCSYSPPEAIDANLPPVNGAATITIPSCCFSASSTPPLSRAGAEPHRGVPHSSSFGGGGGGLGGCRHAGGAGGRGY
jgi:hypothetical protein